MEKRSLRSIEEKYRRAAPHYSSHESPWPQRARIERIDQIVCDQVSECDQILDLACGRGRLLKKLGASRAAGLDLSKDMMEPLFAAEGAEGAQGFELQVGDVHELPFADERFDAVVCTGDSYRYFQPQRALAQIHRVLKAQGLLCIHRLSAKTWAPRTMLQTIDSRHLNKPRDLTRQVHAAGFSLVDLQLLRNLPIRPYILAIPTALPGRFWNHCIATFRKDSI